MLTIAMFGICISFVFFIISGIIQITTGTTTYSKFHEILFYIFFIMCFLSFMSVFGLMSNPNVGG